MLTEQDKLDIAKSITAVANKTYNDTGELIEKYSKVIQENGLDPLINRIKEINIDLFYIKAILKQLGYITDETYNDYRTEFIKLNPDYSNTKDVGI